MTGTSRLIRIALLAGAALIGASAAWAQFPRSTEPMVLSGADVGFKVTGTRDLHIAYLLRTHARQDMALDQHS